MESPSDQIESDLRILVVDDLAPARRIVRGLLQRLGLRNVRDAASVSEALSSLQQEAADLIITDINLKDGNGIDLVRQLRADPTYAELPVIVITADPDREHVIEGAKQGVRGFLLKPFDASRLREKIYAAING
jgi:two-component system chemotaxis response regulator CheY